MPGPFPGMDPYLEDPARWPDVHQGLISAMRALLNALLPPGYVANMGERCQVVPSERSIYPDVFVRNRPTTLNPASQQGGNAAVLNMPDPPLTIEELPLEPSEPLIEIRHAGDHRRIVTTIEVLSPGNKEAGSEGRRRYLQKQQEILGSHTHLIEIDLLRDGRHTVAAPRPESACLYVISLHRGGEGRRFSVWPNNLYGRLPRIAVPLDEGVADLTFDLQTVFDRNYDEGAYALQIDYTRDPVPPLERDDSAWIDALLHEHNLR